MNQKELTKTFMVIQNGENALVSMVYRNIFMRLGVMMTRSLQHWPTIETAVVEHVVLLGICAIVTRKCHS